MPSNTDGEDGLDGQMIALLAELSLAKRRIRELEIANERLRRRILVSLGVDAVAPGPHDGEGGPCAYPSGVQLILGQARPDVRHQSMSHATSRLYHGIRHAHLR